MERNGFGSLGSSTEVKGKALRRVSGVMLAVLAAGLFMASGAQAAITITGDISPTGDPATWTLATNSFIGNTGTGSLTLDGGSSLLSRLSEVGTQAGSNGTVLITGTGTQWNLNYNLFVGYSGTGSLSITNGGVISSSLTGSTGGYLGYNAGSSGTVVVDGYGSKWTNNNYSLYVGFNGSGALTIINGGVVISKTGSYGSSTIGRNAGSTGSVKVDGSSSQWINNSGLSVGSSGTGRLSISDGGTVTTVTNVSINSLATLTTDLGRGSSLNVGAGTGTITNNGTIRLVASAGAANGVYTPISYGTMSGTGTVQALGGIWDTTNHTVTVTSAAAGAAGSALTADLATIQRFLFTDGSTGKSVGAGFQAATSATNLTMTASAISGSELTSLQSLLGTGQAVLSGWDFNATEGYTAGNPVYLSLFAGTGHSLYDLTVWHYDGSAWSKFDASDLAYGQNFASFTATGLSGYAVTGTAPVPIPPAVFLFGSGLSGLFFFRRRKSQE